MNGHKLHAMWDGIIFPDGQSVDYTFIEAFLYVFKKYDWMFDGLEYIQLVPADKMPAFYGLYFPERCSIEIRLGRESILNYIDTLVHELIHHVQHSTKQLPFKDRDEAETQANNYAYLAVKQYNEERSESTNRIHNTKGYES